MKVCGNHIGTMWVLPWIYMGCIWDPTLKSIWESYGNYVGATWDLYGINVGKYMGTIWELCGCYLGSIWDVSGIPHTSHVNPIWDPISSHFHFPYGSHIDFPYGPHIPAHIDPIWDPYFSHILCCLGQLQGKQRILLVLVIYSVP